MAASPRSTVHPALTGAALSFPLKSILRNPYFSLGLLALLGVLAGAALAGQYGESIDEETYYLYGTKSLRLYRDLFAGKPLLAERIINYAPSNLRFYGPAYLLLGSFAYRLIDSLAGQWDEVDIWHLINFLTFLLGALCLYSICARLASRRAAFLAAALFTTQPLLWGHAFINPKDVPFMVFFLATIAAGIQMSDLFFTLSSRDAPRVSPWRSGKMILSLVWAGVILGLCVSVRVLGPAAGLIVAAYLFFKARWKSVSVLFFYFAIAGLVCLATWPYLWGAPIHRFIESIRKMADFPWEGTVLFNGREYRADQLPRTYLLTLLGIQLTEPAILLAALGLAGAARLIWQRSPRWLLSALALGWFFLPVGAAILLRPVLYDNFRQFLFIVPALFVLAGIGFDRLFALVKNKWIASGVVLLCFIPGLVGIVTLHPYQYVYYNQFVGGVQGAARRYELDYWMTSYREAGRFLSEAAEPRARIAVMKYPRLVMKYARKDLKFASYERTCASDYIVISSRHSQDLRAFPGEPLVYTIGRGKAVFAVVRKLVHCQAQAPP